MKERIKSSKLYFYIFGLGTLTWFLIRVIPKPSRAAYPCQRAAFPIASSFVLYLVGISTSIFAFGKMKDIWQTKRYFALSFCLLVIFISGIIILQSDKPYAYADSTPFEGTNNPMGSSTAIFPGRVVWAWNPEATNENCKNDAFGEAYYLTKNSNITVIEEMVSSSVKAVTGKTSIKEAWNSLFISFNEKKGKGAVGYQDGEKIFIKTNGVGASENPDLNSYTMSRTSPQPVLIILRHLINECKIPQANISVGDPQNGLPNELFNLWHNEFPDVKCISVTGATGRVQSKQGNEQIIYSDKGEVLRTGGWGWSDAFDGEPVYDDYLFSVIEEADYMINVSALKVHERAGMTLLAKNYFGSQTRGNAKHMHCGLVNPDGQPVEDPKRDGYGDYRILLDLLGHKKLGGNVILFVVDGLWGGPGANLRPVKFKMTPFNNDWPSSIFMSQDPIALESVCFDFLKEEFTSDRHYETYPQMIGVDDHLHQAADKTNWPVDFKYDPENDGTELPNLGVHEHWNNAANKQYSRDLGTGNGIELIKIGLTGVNESGIQNKYQYMLKENFPNPFNPSTKIRYTLSEPCDVEMKVFDIRGNEITTLIKNTKSTGAHEVTFNTNISENELSSGVYFYRIIAAPLSNESNVFTETGKMILMK